MPYYKVRRVCSGGPFYFCFGCVIITTNLKERALTMYWITPNIQLINGFYGASLRGSAPIFR